MKRIILSLAAMILLMSVTMPAWAETENEYKGEFIGLAGNESLGQGSYLLTDNLKWIATTLEESTLITGLRYELSDRWGVTIGGRYDSELEETAPYGGFDFYMPFFGSNNLKLTGFYDFNYNGEDWNSYEIALRIQMYQNVFIDAGVRGDEGDGYQPYDYNESKEPLLFLRLDCNGQWGKFSLRAQPLLYVTGIILYNSDLKYKLNDRTNLVLNVSNFYDQQDKYRLGIEYKF